MQHKFCRRNVFSTPINLAIYRGEALHVTVLLKLYAVLLDGPGFKCMRIQCSFSNIPVIVAFVKFFQKC